MICEIEFVKQAVKLGKGVNELSFWWSCIYQKKEHMVIVYSLRKSRAGSDGALTVAVDRILVPRIHPKKIKILSVAEDGMRLTTCEEPYITVASRWKLILQLVTVIAYLMSLLYLIADQLSDYGSWPQ